MLSKCTKPKNVPKFIPKPSQIPLLIPAKCKHTIKLPTNGSLNPYYFKMIHMEAKFFLFVKFCQVSQKATSYVTSFQIVIVQ